MNLSYNSRRIYAFAMRNGKQGAAEELVDKDSTAMNQDPIFRKMS
jgi:hypothetical protein